MINELYGNNYPGRGIIIGETMDGENAVIAYFIMGRSVNSRNRVFIEDGQGIKTKAFDESKMSDPSLIIYSPVRVLGDVTVVTNGDQTDTVYDFLKEGKSFGFSYKLSILKHNNGSCQRNFYEYEKATAGVGHLIHTYETDGNPIPSFKGEAKPVKICGKIDDFTKELWESLNEDNRVSLFVRYIDLSDKSSDTRIINAND